MIGYIITQSPTPPSAGAAGWSAAAPTTYTVGSNGTYTLYPWAKDAAGNISPVSDSPATVSVDTVAPTVDSIVRVNASPTNVASVDFLVTFSEPVMGVDTGDFRVTTSGVANAFTANVSGSDATRTLSISTGSGNGTLRLDVPATMTITDPAGNPLDTVPYTSGETYTIDKTAPTAGSLSLPTSLSVVARPTHLL